MAHSIYDEDFEKSPFVYLCLMNGIVRYFFTHLGLLFLGVASLSAQRFFPSEMLDERVNALQIRALSGEGDWMPFPYYTLHSNEGLSIQFDLLDDTPRPLRYQLQHCDAIWQSSPLAPTEYQSGYAEGELPPSIPSSLTKVSYRHYTLELSEESSPHPTLSGNYLLTIFDPSTPQEPLLRVAFAVVEPLATLEASLDKTWGISPDKQHISATLSLASLGRSHMTDEEITLVVAQNNRHDTPQWIRRPSSKGFDQYRYYGQAITFDAGNEYHALEYLSPYIPSMGIERTVQDGEVTQLYSFADENRSRQDFHSTDFGAQGQYVIRSRTLDADVATSTDYYNIHFRFTSDPLPHGYIPLLSGEAFDYLPVSERLLHYDAKEGAYTAELLLKGGYISYLYLATLPKGEAYTQPYKADYTEGNHYATHNRYTLLAYYHPIGSRYDQLIAVASSSK